jgi:hypothetical protein
MAAKKKKVAFEDMIRQEASAKEICESFGIQLLTLQKHVGYISQLDQKFYNIEGLFAPAKPLRVSKMGIIIHKARLMDAPFKLDDEFEMAFDEKQITLTKK